MTTVIAMRFAELGSVFSLVLLWTGLAALFVAIVRRVRLGDGRPPRGL